MRLVRNQGGEVIGVRVSFAEIRERILNLVAASGQRLAEGVVLELDADGRFSFENSRENDLDLRVHNGGKHGKHGETAEKKILTADFLGSKNGSSVRGGSGHSLFDRPRR